MHFFLLFFILILSTNTKASILSNYIDDISNNNPAILSKYNYYLSKKNAKFSVISEFLPQANFDYEYEIQNLERVNSSLNDENEIKNFNFYISQKIIAPELKAKISIAELELENAFLDYQKSKSFFIYDLVTTLVKINSIKIRLSYAENNMKLYENLYNAAKIKNQSGVISEIDLLQSKTAFLSAKSNFISIAKELKLEKIHYEQLTGSTSIAKYSFLSFLPKNDLELTSLVSNAKEHNFDIKILNNKLKQQKLNKKIEITDMLPKANLFYKYYSSRGSYSYYTQDSDKNNIEYYGVEFSVPIFTSFKNSSDLKSNQYLIIEKSEKLNNYHRQLNGQVKSLWEELNVNKALMIENETYEHFAEQSYIAIKKQYEAGIKDISYLLDAQNILFHAKSSLAIAKSNSLQNYFEILFLIGKLDLNIFK